MTQPKRMPFVQERAFACVMVLAVLIVILKALRDGLGLQDNFSTMGNDDITRLLMVRDWIAGQPWFDTTQYRLVPPEGVSLHWSRYVDVGIAAIIVPLSWALPMDLAEMIGTAVWPTLILLLTIFVVGFGARRLFGTYAGCFAVLCLVFWPLTADLHSRAGNLDHHNVQLLMMIILSLAVVWPDRPVGAGAVAGIAAAFSLAVGLETLLFVAGAGLVIWGRAAFTYSRANAQLLFAFCIALAASSVLFWFGQTAPADYANRVCDQLATPALSLIAVAVVASLLPLVVRQFVNGPVVQFIGTIGIAVIGLVLAWPLLGPCITGPYGDLPVAVQDAISSRITEALPGHRFIQRRPAAAMVFLIPVLTALVAGTLLWLNEKPATDVAHKRRRVLGQLLVLCLLGTLMVLIQMRTVIMVAAVVPVIGGVVLAGLLTRYLASRDLKAAMMMLVIAVAITSPNMIVQPLLPYLKQSSTATTATVRRDCQAHDSMQALNAVAPGVLFVHGNFGTRVIWATHHDSLGGLYHRSAAALENGMLAFTLEEGDFKAHVTETTATHLLLCRGYSYGSTYVGALAADEAKADWLRAVPLDDDAQMLFEVIR